MVVVPLPDPIATGAIFAVTAIAGIYIFKKKDKAIPPYKIICSDSNYELCAYNGYDKDKRNGSSTYAFTHESGKNAFNNMWKFVKTDDGTVRIVLDTDCKGQGRWRLSSERWSDRDKRDPASSYVCMHKPPGWANDEWKIGEVAKNRFKIFYAGKGEQKGWELRAVRWKESDERNSASTYVILHVPTEDTAEGAIWKIEKQ